VGQTAIESERRQQVDDDVVVIAGVEGDIIATGLDHRLDDVNRLVAVEGGDLHADDFRDLRKLAPEAGGECASADRRLEVKTDEGDFPGER
jgi:hypothetical protein